MLVAATLLLGLAGPGPLTLRFTLPAAQDGAVPQSGNQEGQASDPGRKPGKSQEGAGKSPKGKRKSQENGVSNEELQDWYDKSEEVFQDEEAVRRGREILQKSLEFHGWDDFQKSGGVILDTMFHEYSYTKKGEPVLNLRGFGSLYLMPGWKGVYQTFSPSKDRVLRGQEVRLVSDGETSWIFAGKRDNHSQTAIRNAWNRCQRERFLCGLPFALNTEGIDIAFIKESEVLEHPTWRVRVRLPRGKAVALGLWTYGGNPEPVRIFQVEFFQDTYQVAAIDYFMWRSGRMEFTEPYFVYRHEFSREFADDRFHVPKERTTVYNERKGRFFDVTKVSAGTPPDDFFVRSWEILDRLPMGDGNH